METLRNNALSIVVYEVARDEKQIDEMKGRFDFGRAQLRSYRPIETTIPQEDSIVNYL